MGIEPRSPEADKGNNSVLKLKTRLVALMIQLGKFVVGWVGWWGG